MKLYISNKIGIEKKHLQMFVSVEKFISYLYNMYKTVYIKGGGIKMKWRSEVQDEVGK